MAQNANVTTNWTQEYSRRKHSISSGSYYPSSSEAEPETETEIELEEEEDTWSEVFEEPPPKSDVNFSDAEFDDDKEKTPIQFEGTPPSPSRPTVTSSSSKQKSYDDYDFVKAIRPSYGSKEPPVSYQPVEKLWRTANYGEIVEKRPPTIAMARRSSTERPPKSGYLEDIGYPDRTKSSDINLMEVKLFKEKAERSYEQALDAVRQQRPQQRPASRAGLGRSSDDSTSASPSRYHQPQRPASRAGTSSSSREIHYNQQQQEQLLPVQVLHPNQLRPVQVVQQEQLRPEQLIRKKPARSPSPSASASNYDVFELSRSPSLTSTATGISEITISSSNNNSPASGSKVGKCPHCNIHSWLPHSPNCPKKK